MHRMTFYWSTDVGVFMFPGLNVNGLGQLITLCVILFIFAAIYEAVKIIQTKKKSRVAREILHDNSCPASALLNDEENQTDLQRKIQKRRKLSERLIRALIQTLIFLFQTILGYLLMLAVMVYNGYVFLIIIFGFAIGYFFFGHLAMKINMENIRARKTHVICSPSCPTQPSQSINCTNGGNQSTCSSNSSTKHKKHHHQHCEKGGYTNELAISSSSSSLSNSLTQTTQLDKEIDVHINYNNDSDDNDNDNDSNIIQSCRL